MQKGGGCMVATGVRQIIAGDREGTQEEREGIGTHSTCGHLEIVSGSSL